MQMISKHSVAFSATVLGAYSGGCLVLCSVHQLFYSLCNTFRGQKMQEANSKDEGGMERRSVEKGISSAALYLLPAEPEEIIFQSSIHQTSSLMYSPFLLCVYVCPHTVSVSDSLFSPHPLLFSPFLTFSILFSVPISVPCISFLFTCSTLRWILFHSCSLEGPIQNLLHTQTLSTQTIQLLP